MRVIATAKGYDNIALRLPGDEFEMPDDATGTWFEPVSEHSRSDIVARKRGESDDDRPKTVSGLAKQQAKHLA